MSPYLRAPVTLAGNAVHGLTRSPMARRFGWNTAFMLYSEAFQSIDPSFDEINQIGIEAQKIEDKIDLNYFKSENNLYLQQLVKSISKL